MKSFFTTPYLVVAVLLLGGCAGGGHEPIDIDAQAVTCTEPRPEVCTREIRPVCALLESSHLVTRANACWACADPYVISYHEGYCG